MTEIKLPPLPEGWETELLDWVSACQSAYHIDNTPGHRFGGLGSNLEENRSEIVCFVRGLIESHATALQSQDLDDAIDPLQGAANWLVEAIKDCDSCDLQYQLFIGHNRAQRLLDHARRIEGES